MRNTHTLALKIITLILTFVLVTPMGMNALAAEMGQARASDYIDSYSTYIYAPGNGKLEIWFSIYGVDDMDEIGVLSIKLYESTDQTNWTWVKTYSRRNYPSMLIEDDWVHSSYVSYTGVADLYYKAYVGFWAGNNGAGDSRYVWTSVVRAN